MLFKDVVGHEEVKKHLIESVKNNRVSHAQMFLGEEGGGNFPLALAYAQYLNCSAPTDEDSCGKCSNCIKYSSFQHPDLNFFFPSSTSDIVKKTPSSKQYLKEWIEFLGNNEYFDLSAWTNFIGAGEKVAQINKLDSQDIIKCFNLKNFEGKYKVVLIWWPEKMNIECSNKILKILEEPTPNSVFLLVGHNSEDLLATIISRVQIVKLKKLSNTDIKEGLLEKEGVPEDLADSLSILADGSFFKALELLKNPDGDEQFVEMFQNWMRLCYVVDYLKLSKFIDEMFRLGRVKQMEFLNYGLRVFRECIVYNYASPELNRLNQKEAGFNMKFSKFIHGGNILELIELFEDTHTAISRNGYAKVSFMNLSLKVCNLLKYKP